MSQSRPAYLLSDHVHTFGPGSSRCAVVLRHLSCAPCVRLQYGQVNEILIPRPGDGPGVGKVIINYADAPSAIRAFQVMDGRKFGGNPVRATYLTDDAYAQKLFD